MQAYVINLARSHDRRAHIVAQLNKTKLGYEIVNAVDGKDLDLSDARIVSPAFAAANIVHPGVVGCALSHLEIYSRILDTDLDVACILEDDVVLAADLCELIDAITPRMKGASVVLLNFQSQKPARIIKVGAEQLPSARLLVQFADENQAASAGGYLITREACARMVKTVLPVRTVADDWASFRKDGAIDSLRCVIPMPVVQSPSLRTTLSYYRPGNLYASFREAVASSRIPILRHALAFRRERYLRRFAIGRIEFVEEFPEGSPGPQEIP